MNTEEQLAMGKAISALQLMVDGVTDPEVVWGYRVAMADDAVAALARVINNVDVPIPMVLHCPKCHKQHVDQPEPETNWTNPPHKSHKCMFCHTIWRPADVPTYGVELIRSRGKEDNWPACDLR